MNSAAALLIKSEKPKGKPLSTGKRKPIRAGNGADWNLLESEKPKSESRTVGPLQQGARDGNGSGKVGTAKRPKGGIAPVKIGAARV